MQFDLSLMASNGGLGPVALVRDLQRAGEIVDGHLTHHGDLRSGVPQKLTYDVLFATPIPQDVLGQLLLDSLGVGDLPVIPVEVAELTVSAEASPS